MRKGLWLLFVVCAAACGTPAGPTPGPIPTVGPATPPVIQSITGPSTRVEAGQDITITAVVTDAETPLAQLTYQWAASAGTIVGNGATATWRHPAGITKGVDAVITLTVVDNYQAVDGRVIVQRQFQVVGQAAPFRVHDSAAEMKELARKFLLDLFGNSAIPPIACLVDFTEAGRCARGKQAELDDIIENRQLVEIKSGKIYSQVFVLEDINSARVISDAEFFSVWKHSGEGGVERGPFIVTGIYEQSRWWLCESTYDPPAGNGPLSVLSRKRSGGRLPIK